MNNITNSTFPEQNELTYKVMLGVLIFMLTGIFALILLCVVGSLNKRRNQINPI